MAKGKKYTALTGGGAGALDARDGADLSDGDVAVVMVSGVIYWYELDADSGATASPPNVIAPITNAGTKRWILQRVPSTGGLPQGAVVAYFPGYFSDANNGGFAPVVGNNAAEINAEVNPDGLHVMNGALLNMPGSKFFDGGGRYLPNVTGDRILVGRGTAGVTGGSASHAHMTAGHALTEAENGPHDHGVPKGTGGTGGGAYMPYNASGYNITTTSGEGVEHDHGATSTASSYPPFLTCWWLIKVI